MAIREDLEPQPSQERVAARVAGDDPRMLVYAGLGRGKSLTAILAAERAKLQGGGDYGIAVPASLRDNFQKELDKFTDDPSAEILSHTGLGMGKQFQKPLGTLIVDESQRLRNGSTSAARAIAAQAALAKRLLLLSGTPIVNDPSDLAAPLSMLTGKNISSEEFSRRFIGNRPVYPNWWARLRGVSSGEEEFVDNESELRDLLKGHVDYEPGRDPKGVSTNEQTVEVPLTKQQRRIQNAVRKRIPTNFLWKLDKDFPLSKEEVIKLNAFMTGLRQSSLSTKPFQSNPNDLKAFEQSGKLQAAMGKLKTMLGEDPRRKAIVYSNFIDAGLNPYAAALAREGIPSSMFHGGISTKQRKQNLEDYNSGKSRALLLGPAGAAGISTRGTNLIQLLGPHWNEAQSQQAIGRGLRFDSHEGLSEELKNVLIQRFMSSSKEPSMLGKMLGYRRERTGDEIVESIANRKEVLNEKFREILRDEGSQDKVSGLDAVRRLLKYVKPSFLVPTAIPEYATPLLENIEMDRRKFLMANTLLARKYLFKRQGGIAKTLMDAVSAPEDELLAALLSRMVKTPYKRINLARPVAYAGGSLAASGVLGSIPLWWPAVKGLMNSSGDSSTWAGPNVGGMSKMAEVNKETFAMGSHCNKVASTDKQAILPQTVFRAILKAKSRGASPGRLGKFWKTFDRWLPKDAHGKTRLDRLVTKSEASDPPANSGIMSQLFELVKHRRSAKAMSGQATQSLLLQGVPKTALPKITMGPGAPAIYLPHSDGGIISSPMKLHALLHEAGHAVNTLRPATYTGSGKPHVLSSRGSPDIPRDTVGGRWVDEARANLFGRRMAKQVGVPNYMADRGPGLGTYQLADVRSAREQLLRMAKRAPGLGMSDAGVRNWTAEEVGAPARLRRLMETMPVNNRKVGAALEPTVAGLCLKARDTGRVLLLQRAVDDKDPASGSWEFPGGHVESGESSLTAAKREWREEIGSPLPMGFVTGQWGSGIYRGHVYEIAKEELVKINRTGPGRKYLNPDDPDQDHIEVAAWHEPLKLKRDPTLRAELRASMRQVQAAIDPYAFRLEKLRERRMDKVAAEPTLPVDFLKQDVNRRSLATLERRGHMLPGLRTEVANQLAPLTSVTQPQREMAEYAILDRRNPNRSNATLIGPGSHPFGRLGGWLVSGAGGAATDDGVWIDSDTLKKKKFLEGVGLQRPGVLNHEYEHAIAQPALEGKKQLTRRLNIETGPSIGDVVFAGQRDRMLGLPTSHVNVDVGGKGRLPHKLDWMVDRAKEHGYFDGRSMTDLLFNNTAGKQWLMRQSGATNVPNYGESLPTVKKSAAPSFLSTM